MAAARSRGSTGLIFASASRRRGSVYRVRLAAGRRGICLGKLLQPNRTMATTPLDRHTINDDRRAQFGTPGRLIAFVCECGDPECHEAVILTAGEYDARQPRPILRPGHTRRPAA